MRISVIVPAYNEEKTIEELIERIFKVIPNSEIIVVDDHSTDSTAEKVELLQRQYRNLKLVEKKGERGKTAALLQGFRSAAGEILVMIDADLEYSPEEIPKMLRLIERGKDVVVGKRIFKKIASIRRFLSFCYNLFFGKLLLGIPLNDIQAGQKAFKKEVLESISIGKHKWGFDTEFLFRSKEAGFKLDEVEVSYLSRKTDKDVIALLGISLELMLLALSLFLERLLKRRLEGRERGKI
jgi:glycosyltransferase involved in cell wall biosynthesis